MLQEPNQGENAESCPKAIHIIVIALGSNLTSLKGPPKVTLLAALASLEKAGALIRAISPFYATPAFPKGNGPDYVNAVAVVSAPWSPAQALEVLHAIEAEAGRERVQRWGQRTLDLDMIAHDDTVSPNPETHQHWRDLPLEAQIASTPDELVLPHPRLQDRAFVLVPMADVAPGWVHPILGKTVKSMLEALPEVDRMEVQRIE